MDGKPIPRALSWITYVVAAPALIFQMRAVPQRSSVIHIVPFRARPERMMPQHCGLMFEPCCPHAPAPSDGLAVQECEFTTGPYSSRSEVWMFESAIHSTSRMVVSSELRGRRSIFGGSTFVVIVKPGPANAALFNAMKTVVLTLSSPFHSLAVMTILSAVMAR